MTDPGLRPESLWALKTGNPPKSIDEYHPDVLSALLHYQDEMRKEVLRMVRRNKSRMSHWTRRKPPAQKGSTAVWEDRLETGDPLADQWEAQLARGEMPDLDAKGPG